MKTFIVSIIAFVGLLAMAAVVNAAGGRSWNMVEAQTSSGTVGDVSLEADVLAIWASSDTNNFSNLFVLFDSIPANSLTGPNQLTTWQATPSFNFIVSSIAFANDGIVMNKVADFGAEGIYFQNAPYVFKTAGTSGQARRVWLELRR